MNAPNASTLVFAGSPGSGTANTESWDGTSWTEVADLSPSRWDVGGAGDSVTSAIAFGGGTPTIQTATEEWTAADFLIKTVTTS